MAKKSEPDRLAFLAAADMLSRVKARMRARSGKTIEDTVPESEWNEIRAQVAATHKISPERLDRALRETGESVRRRKRMN